MIFKDIMLSERLCIGLHIRFKTREDESVVSEPRPVVHFMRGWVVPGQTLGRIWVLEMFCNLVWVGPHRCPHFAKFHQALSSDPCTSQWVLYTSMKKDKEKTFPLDFLGILKA